MAITAINQAVLDILLIFKVRRGLQNAEHRKSLFHAGGVNKLSEMPHQLRYLIRFDLCELRVQGWIRRTVEWRDRIPEG